MKVILLKDVPKVGKRGEVRDTADGFAVNFLIPKKLAEPATPKRISAVQEKLARSAQQDAETQEARVALVKELDGKRFEVAVPANEKGKLYEKLTAPKINGLVPEIPVEVIHLDDPIQETGEHEVPIAAGESSGTVTIAVAKS